MRAVVNAAIRKAQRAGREITLDTDYQWENLLPDPEVGPETAAEAAELESAIAAALHQLAPEQRAAIVLHYYLGYTNREIAELVGSPEGTIKWRLHAARQQLRDELQHLKEQPDG
jgi:RNA polymerase sigma-70 factor (ECF subfamily)